MDNRIDAVYARQSVDKKESISIESQVEFCKYELKGGSFKEYIDKGYSGKNTDRPCFKQLVTDIEQGLIQRVVVYKLDRISRSVIDFANMMELFQRNNVEFVSTTEKFDTSTPMGRAMLTICIAFAQLERETIQKRVSDAFYSRCQKGFHVGSVTPYGFTLEPVVIDGIKTKKFVANPVEMERVKMMFDMYAEPNTSFGDISRHFAKMNLDFDGKELQRCTVSYLLRNPVYVQADLEVYEYFKTQGAVIVNDASDYSGMNGCYLYRPQGSPHKRRAVIKDGILVLAPHEGFIPSDTWLACQKKMLNNINFGTDRKAKRTWLAGKIKCGRCGAALVGVDNKLHILYFRCRRRTDNKSCEGCGTLRILDVEQFIHDEMQKKMSEFQTLTGGISMKANPKLTALKVELAQVDNEIEKLLDTLTGANSTLLSYANGKIEELDTRRQALLKAIADMSAETSSPEQMKRISNYLNKWSDTSFDDRRIVVDGLVSVIRATRETIQIEWKI